MFRLPAVHVALIAISLATQARASEQWPDQDDTDNVNIGTELHSGYEPSGLCWHPVAELMLSVSDQGYITALELDGDVVWEDFIGGDLEGICYANANSYLVYVVNEATDEVIEYDIDEQDLTGRSWDLTTGYGLPAHGVNEGFECIEFIPVSGDSQGGFFVCGLQDDGTYYAFRLPIISGSTITHLDQYDNTPGPSEDCSGMHYDRLHKILYVLFDGANEVYMVRPLTGTMVNYFYDVPPSDTTNGQQEGFALIGCEAYIAYDSSSSEVHRILIYDFDLPNSDSDDVPDCQDLCPGTWCNPVDEDGCTLCPVSGPSP